MEKLAWFRSLNPSLCLPCRKAKRYLKAQFICSLCFNRVPLAFCSRRRKWLRESQGPMAFVTKFRFHCIFVSSHGQAVSPCALPTCTRELHPPLSLGSPWICANSLRKGWIFQDAISGSQGQLKWSQGSRDAASWRLV